MLHLTNKMRFTIKRGSGDPYDVDDKLCKIIIVNYNFQDLIRTGTRPF